MNRLQRNIKLIRSIAPLRIGFAGGGTDVSPYSDLFGGAVLNASIDMYAYVTIHPQKDDYIIFRAIDLGVSERYAINADNITLEGPLALLKAVYKRLIKQYPIYSKQSFILETFSEVPAGSGLGTSSTLVVSLLKAFAEWWNLPMGEYDLAHIAYEIERIDLGFAGGKQDQYAAAFGGVNFMEFYADDKVIVNPLRIKEDFLHELESCLILYYTGKSRLSSDIITTQQNNVRDKQMNSVEAMHELKNQAIQMKEAVLNSSFDLFGNILNYGWLNKKKMAVGITNSTIDEAYEKAINAGASGGKI